MNEMNPYTPPTVECHFALRTIRTWAAFLSAMLFGAGLVTAFAMIAFALANPYEPRDCRIVFLGCAAVTLLSWSLLVDKANGK